VNGGGGGGQPQGNGAPQGGGQFNPEDARQLTREMQQRLGEAQALREELARQRVDVSALDRAIESMRTMSARSPFDDTESAKMLRSQVVEGLKAFEFSLRRSLNGPEDGRVLSGRTGDVPPAFKAQVEEYYRSIAKPPSPATSPVPPKPPKP
jgi:hypothetical protein